MNGEYKRLDLQMRIVGEQEEQIVIPFDKFVVTDKQNVLDKISADSRKEKFVYAYTDSGVSDNKRDWSAEIMRSMADQVVEKLPVGYLGHIKPQDYGFEFPEPQILWLGSYVEKLEGDFVRLWLKGYLLPTADKLETWIQTEAVNSISVYGKVQYTMVDDVMKIGGVDLKSIDVSRKNGEGLNSKILGLYGEMDSILKGGAYVKTKVGQSVVIGEQMTYDELRNKLQDKAKELYAPIAKSKNFNNTDQSIENNYWLYVNRLYVDSNEVIFNVNANDAYSYYSSKYTIDENGDILLTALVEVEETFSPVKKPNEEVGEMSVLGFKTIAGFKLQHPEMFEELRSAIAAEMQDASRIKTLETKAGEMDAVAVMVGEQSNVAEVVKSLLSFRSDFVGEMAVILVGESAEGVTPEVLVEKAQELVKQNQELSDTVAKVTEVVGVTDGQSVVDAVSNVVSIQQVAIAKQAIANVEAKFGDLTKDMDQTVVEYLRDDFADLLAVEPVSIKAEDWEVNALAKLEADMPAKAQRHTDRLAKIFESAKAVGEMSSVLNLGSNVRRETPAKQPDANLDPDIVEANRLGYGG